MFTDERHAYILNKIQNNDRVSVSNLSKELRVSEVTIRKDLNFLEGQNLLKRTYGGAVAPLNHVIELGIKEKSEKNIEQKDFIANKASQLIDDGLNIFLDAGTTIQAILPYLNKYKDLNIITYDLEIAYRLSKSKDINTYLLGGYIDTKTKTPMSIEGYDNLEKIHADLSFIGTDAFDQDFVYSTTENKAKIKNRMILNSQKSILLCDSSKFNKKGLYSFNRMDDFDYIITDTSNNELNNYIQLNNIKTL